jgi:hypothetical protein
MCVKSGVRGCAGARERATRSARAGRHDGVDLARSWRCVRSGSRSSGLGIDQGGLREASGKVMGRGTVGGVQLRSGALGGDGVAQGRRGVAVLGLYKAGPG